MTFNWNSVIRPSNRSVPLSEESLLDFEAFLGFDLPEEYRRFLQLFDGGAVACAHDIPMEGSDYTAEVAYFYPLSKKSTDFDVVQAREIQVQERLLMRQAIQIGSDAGPGLFYLLLDGWMTGSVFFTFRDEPLFLSPTEWNSDEVIIPDCMIKVASNFDELGELILVNRT